MHVIITSRWKDESPNVFKYAIIEFINLFINAIPELRGIEKGKVEGKVFSEIVEP